MRTEQRWKENHLPGLLQQFTPRIQKDLQSIPFPEDIEDPLKSKFIQGKVESGKTIYACFLMLEEQKRMYLNDTPGECIFVSTPDLFHELRSCYDDPNKSEQEILDRFKTCHLLILDDFGTTKPTDWVMQILYLIINYRYEHLLTTIYTCNKSLDELMEYFEDERVVSRIERSAKISEKSHWKKS